MNTKIKLRIKKVRLYEREGGEIHIDAITDLEIGDELLCTTNVYRDGKRVFFLGRIYRVSHIENDNKAVLIDEFNERRFAPEDAFELVSTL